MKIFFLLSIILFGSHFTSFAQTIKPQKKGLIVFEGINNYEMYFIETSSCRHLICMFDNNDTVNAITLGSPGDAVNDISGFKWYLEKAGVCFDSINLLIADTNHLGYGYEDTTNFYSKFGNVQYVKSKVRKMNRHFKKVYWKGRLVVIVSEYFVPIESFTVAPIIKKLKRSN